MRLRHLKAYGQWDMNAYSFKNRKEELIVSGIGMIERRLQDFGIRCAAINYPKELDKYLGRRIWKSTINKIANTPASWPVFVKSVEGKRLSGRIVNSIHDLMGSGCCDDNYEVLCSEPVNFIAEWRVFVRYGKILDIRPYKGDWKVHYAPSVIEDAIRMALISGLLQVVRHYWLK